MRRDMMSELAKILGDDPRLRSRYLDLIRRRRANLRSQLAEINARQDQSLQEVLGWLGVSEEQRENYWLQISDLRLDVPKEMAKEAQAYTDRIEKQLPLVLDGGVGTAKALIDLSKQITLDTRRCDFVVKELRKSGGELTDGSAMSAAAGDLVFRILILIVFPSDRKVMFLLAFQIWGAHGLLHHAAFGGQIRHFVSPSLQSLSPCLERFTRCAWLWIT